MSYDVVIFGIKLTLSPVAFSIPLGSRHWDIYWYGIIIATGFLLALIYGIKNAARLGINTDRMLDVVLVATPVAILSARAYYLIFDGEKLNGIGDFFGFGDGFVTVRNRIPSDFWQKPEPLHGKKSSLATAIQILP